MHILIIIGLLATLCVSPVNAAKSPKELRSETLLQGAKRCFRAGQWGTAAAWFKEFIAGNPNSPQRNKATLYRAQALYRLKQYRECFNELKNAEESSGLLAAEYKFWMAECRYREAEDAPENAGLYRVAAQLYAEVPKSDRLVEANVTEAMAHARLEDWPKVVELLQPEAGPFQKYASNSPEAGLSLQGQLILAEALLRQNLYSDATNILTRLGDLNLADQDHWRHQMLFARALIAQKRSREALKILQELLRTSENRMPELRAAQAFELKSLAHRELGQFTEAVDACQNLWKEGMPEAVRRRGLLLTLQLAVRHAAPLDIPQFLFQSKSALKGDSLSAVQVALGDMQLIKLQQNLHAEKRLTQKNLLEKSRGLYNAALGSTFSGFAQIGLAWNAWQKEQYGESHKIFTQAATKPINARERNRALFKAMESAFLAGNMQGSLDAGHDFLKNSPTAVLKDTARLLMLRAAIRSANTGQSSLAGARKIYSELTANKQVSKGSKYATLLLARAESESHNQDKARELLGKISRDPSLKTAVELESARTFIRERKWSNAITHYKAWLEMNKNASLAQQAKITFDLGWLHHLNNDFTKAEEVCLSVVSKYPDAPEAARAHMWIADRSFSGNNPNYVKAEEEYQKVRDIKKCPILLRYRASLMAGRSAMARGSFDNAREYFEKINNADECPKQIKAEAAFALSDAVILNPAKDEFNSKFNHAINILESHLKPDGKPLSHVALQAYARIGDCHLQMAAKDPNRYLKAREAYGRVINISSQMGDDPPVRYRAMIGMALSLKNAPEEDSRMRTENLIQALGWAKKVFEGATATGTTLDPFWARESGLISAELQSLAGKPREAIATYETLARHYKKMELPLNAKIVQIRQRIRESSVGNSNGD